MSDKKTVLIVTDGTEKTVKMAGDIAKALKGHKVSIREASAFAGTDLLPAQVLFFGCGESSPPSFEYLYEMLGHINLAGRSCGVFSPSSAKAGKYLTQMVKSSEITLNPEILTEANLSGLSEWAAKVIACGNHCEP